MELTSRELATLIIFVAFVASALVLGRKDGGLRTAVRGLVRAFAHPKVWTVLLAFGVYAAGVVALAFHLGIWDFSLLKDTVIVIVFVGIPYVLNSAQTQGGIGLARQVLRDSLGVAALLVAYLNLAPLDLWAEVLVQAGLGFFAFLAAAARHTEGLVPIARASDVLAGLIVIALAVHVLATVVTQFDTFDWQQEAATLLLAIWLPLAFIPFIYPFAFIVLCESALSRVAWLNKRTKPPLRVRAALMLGFHFSLRYASRFSMDWIPRMGAERTFRSARSTMREYRATVRLRDREKRDREFALRRWVGVRGVGPDGLWLDRREFHETKEALQQLWWMQRGGVHDINNRYASDPQAHLFSFVVAGLPDPHGIQSRVRGDRRAWMAWRETSGGYFFGVGGSADVDRRWEWDSTDRPEEFPRAGLGAWYEVIDGDHRPEWARDDGPIPKA